MSQLIMNALIAEARELKETVQDILKASEENKQ